MRKSYTSRHITDPCALVPYRTELHALFKQLSQSMTEQDFIQADFFTAAACVRSYSLFMFDQGLIGMGFLVPIHKALRFEGHLEDIVVLERYRGQGIGQYLVERLIEQGRRQGMSTISLTSNPDNPNRKEAIGLYQKLGFKPANGLMRLTL